LTGLLSVAAGLLELASTSIYIRRLVQGKTILNTTTWLVALITMTMNTVSYIMVVHAELAEILLPILINIGIIIIFFYALLKGRFAKIDLVDTVVLGLSLVIGVIWKTTNNAELANVALQVVLLISLVPMVVGLIKGTLRDHHLPWVLSWLAYLLQTIIVLLDSSGWHWSELAFPVGNGLIGNGAIVLAVLWQQRYGKQE